MGHLNDQRLSLVFSNFIVGAVGLHSASLSKKTRVTINDASTTSLTKDTLNPSLPFTLIALLLLGMASAEANVSRTKDFSAPASTELTDHP